MVNLTLHIDHVPTRTVCTCSSRHASLYVNSGSQPRVVFGAPTSTAPARDSLPILVSSCLYHTFSPSHLSPQAAYSSGTQSTALQAPSLLLGAHILCASPPPQSSDSRFPQGMSIADPLSRLETTMCRSRACIRTSLLAASGSFVVCRCRSPDSLA